TIPVMITSPGSRMVVFSSDGSRSENNGFATSCPDLSVISGSLRPSIYRSTGYRKSLPKRRFWSKQRKLMLSCSLPSMSRALLGSPSTKHVGSKGQDPAASPHDLQQGSFGFIAHSERARGR